MLLLFSAEQYRFDRGRVAFDQDAVITTEDVQQGKREIGLLEAGANAGGQERDFKRGRFALDEAEALENRDFVGLGTPQSYRFFRQGYTGSDLEEPVRGVLRGGVTQLQDAHFVLLTRNERAFPLLAGQVFLVDESEDGLPDRRPADSVFRADGELA